MMVNEIKEHLINKIIPFWSDLKDKEYGGYYGYMDFDSLTPDKEAVKGCILHSRILWFFSNAYTLLKDTKLLNEAKHCYEFIKNYCFDDVNGGIYWSLTYDGKPYEDLKHTYNQAFCIYALSSYYEASGDKDALNKAYELYNLIETRCMDDKGYKECFTKEFEDMENDKLSENGVMAEKTMNTLLHVFEAYTELYRVDKNEEVADRLRWIMDIFLEKMYNPALHRQEVFFDADYNTLIDLHSYGHDIETAWLIDRGIEVLGDAEYEAKMSPMTKDLTQNIYNVAFDGHSLSNECERGVVNTLRVWWVQAETVVGFINGYEKSPEKKEYLEAAKAQWEYIKEYILDKREGSEWYSEVDIDGKPSTKKPIVEPWKCPYHNGRMCFEVIRRNPQI